MAVGSRAFWLPRRGNTAEEYEDAFALEDASGRYAVADGASEGCFTGLWARLLVEDFVARAEGDASRWSSSLPTVQERWDVDIRARKLDWDADYWVEQGASATFLGIVLTGEGQGTTVSPRLGTTYSWSTGEGQGVRASCRWQAIAVGDTCLFHTRDNVLLGAFPLERSDQFDNRPQLVGSHMSAAAVGERQRLWSDGCGQPGDRLWAMTDALARWCLATNEAGGDPWGELDALHLAPAYPTQQDEANNRFAAWIESLRDAGRLTNDDVTLLAIRL